MTRLASGGFRIGPQYLVDGVTHASAPVLQPQAFRVPFADQVVRMRGEHEDAGRTDEGAHPLLGLHQESRIASADASIYQKNVWAEDDVVSALLRAELTAGDQGQQVIFERAVGRLHDAGNDDRDIILFRVNIATPQSGSQGASAISQDIRKQGSMPAVSGSQCRVSIVTWRPSEGEIFVDDLQVVLYAGSGW